MDSAIELKNFLSKIFPSFEEEWEKNEEITSFHSVLLAFTPYFSVEINNCTKEQLKKLSGFINESVQKPNDLENAISTCFLEHLGQIDADKILKPFLSKQAKGKLHA